VQQFLPASDTKIVYGSSIDAAATETGKTLFRTAECVPLPHRAGGGVHLHGKDQLGLAPVKTENDPTLRKGDIVAGEGGLAVANRGNDKRGASLNFRQPPDKVRARYQRVPVVARDNHSQTRVMAGFVPAMTRREIGAARIFLKKTASLSVELPALDLPRLSRGLRQTLRGSEIFRFPPRNLCISARVLAPCDKPSGAREQKGGHAVSASSVFEPFSSSSWFSIYQHAAARWPRQTDRARRRQHIGIISLLKYLAVF